MVKKTSFPQKYGIFNGKLVKIVLATTSVALGIFTIIVAHLLTPFLLQNAAFEAAADIVSISFEYQMSGIYLDNFSGSDTDLDAFFYDRDDDDDDDYYMHFSERDDDDDFDDDDDHQLNFEVLRGFLFRRFQPYGDGGLKYNFEMLM